MSKDDRITTIRELRESLGGCRSRDGSLSYDIETSAKYGELLLEENQILQDV